MGSLLAAAVVILHEVVVLTNGQTNFPDVNGEITRGLPCVKRLNQLYCQAGGTEYPTSNIDSYIDDNKALMRRMYGDPVQEEPAPEPLPHIPGTPASTTLFVQRMVRNFGGARFKRSVQEGFIEDLIDEDMESVDLSRIEVTTPYWATNSKGKVRAIVNNKQFEQAVHQEICRTSRTFRCAGDYGCEQKYKWHRLLAYDPNQGECGGIFMDWFLFPSCCACRCRKNPLIDRLA